MNNKKKLKLIKKLCKNASPDDWGVPYVYASQILEIINKTQAEKCDGGIMGYRPSFKLINAATGETVVQHIIASAFAYMEGKANDNQEDMKYWEESIAFWVQQLTKNG